MAARRKVRVKRAVRSEAKYSEVDDQATTIVIWNNASTDGTTEYLESLDHPRITVVNHDENIGQSAYARAFRALPEVAVLLSQGPGRSAVRLGVGLPVDLRVVPPRAWGAALHFHTGSRAHNAALHARWGLDAAAISRLRELLVGGGAAAAADMVPAAAIDDLIVADADPTHVGKIARELDASSLALPAFSISES